MGRPANTVERMMAEKVSVGPGGCWEWSGKIAPNGYGHTTIRKKHLLAHRVFYEAHKGPIPDGLQIDHLCRNRCCVNPDHLEAVTCRENQLRGPGTQAAINTAKTHCNSGHALDGSNLYVRRRGDRTERHCNTCRAAATERWRQKNRGA